MSVRRGFSPVSDTMLSSTAGWGSSVKPESDADQRLRMSSVMMKNMPHLRTLVMKRRVYLTEVRGVALLRGSGESGYP